MFRLEKRPNKSRFWVYAAPPVAVLLTIVVGMGLFALLGSDPLVAIKAIFWDPVFGEFAFYYRPEIVKKAAPLILIATGLAFGFRAGIWNIGAEGQYIVGAICGAAVALAFYPSESRWIVFPLSILAGAVGGMIWAAIPAILKIRFKTNEILVSLMLVYVAQVLITAFSSGLLRNPEGHGFPGSRNLNQYPAAANGELIAGWGIHWGVVAAFAVVAVSYVVLTRHRFGFDVRLAGQSPRAASFSGVEPSRLIFVSMLLSGGLAGLAGVFEVTGPAGQILASFPKFYGFTAIIVAYLGRLHPLGILLAGFLLALTYIGGEVAQDALQMPAAAIMMFQGMLLFSILAVDMLTDYRIRFGKEVR